MFHFQMYMYIQSSYFEGCILFYTKIEYGGLMGLRVDHCYSTGL